MRKIKHCPTNAFKIQWQNKTVYLFLDTIIDHRKEKMNSNSSLFSTHKFKLNFKFKVMNYECVYYNNNQNRENEKSFQNLTL